MIRYSIVVPVYNMAAWLQECLASVLAQTYAAWELIVVDDGSTDGSPSLCDDAAADVRVRVLHRPHCGVSDARNAGLALARGEYILFLDADDCLAPHALCVIDQAVAQSDVLLFRATQKRHALDASSVPRSVRIASSDELAALPLTVIYRQDQDALHGFNVNTVIAAVYRRQLLEKARARFDGRLRIGEDKLFNFLIFQRVQELRTVENCLYYHRPNPRSATRAYMPHALPSNAPLLSAMEESISAMPEGDQQEAYRRRMACAGYQVVRNALTLDLCHRDNRASFHRRMAQYVQTAAPLLDDRALPQLNAYDRYLFTLFRQPFWLIDIVMHCRPLRLAGYALGYPCRVWKKAEPHA